MGYSYLSKTEDYESVNIDASFYALNYPRHRFTAAFTYSFFDQFELRMDTELRSQQKNLLRRSEDTAVLSALSLHWIVPQFTGLRLGFTVDNLFDSDFEEIPGTPGVGRQISSSVSYRW